MLDFGIDFGQLFEYVVFGTLFYIGFKAYLGKSEDTQVSPQNPVVSNVQNILSGFNKTTSYKPIFFSRNVKVAIELPFSDSAPRSKKKSEKFDLNIDSKGFASIDPASIAIIPCPSKKNAYIVELKEVDISFMFQHIYTSSKHEDDISTILSVKVINAYLDPANLNHVLA